MMNTNKIRGLARCFMFGSGLIFFFLTSSPFLPFMYLWPLRFRPIVVTQLRMYCKYCLLFMGIKVNIKGPYRGVLGQRPQLVVSNHLSYIDVLVMGAIYPTAFVTSMEIKETPFLGQMAILGGCVFVERRNKTNINAEIKEITESLLNGVSVTIFPEATSTNGQGVLRFKRPLFNAAYDAKVDILPLTINYRELGGQKLDYQNKDFVFWYGDMTFAGHLWNFFKLRNIHVDVNIGKPINIKDFEVVDDLVIASHQAVASEFDPVVLTESSM